MISLAFFLLALLPGPQAQSSVAVSEKNGDLYCDVQARDIEVHRLMAQLGRELGLKVVGFEDVEESQRISVFLRERPVDQTIQYILGSAGLSATVTARTIAVSGELPPFPDSQAVLDAAEMAFVTTLTRFPKSAEAPTARLSLAGIALDQGNPSMAVRHYETLIEDFPDDSRVQDAHMSAGRLLVELEEWVQALPHFQEIANIKLDEKTPAELFPVVAEARRELARCILMRGEARRAQFMLQGLEHSLPATTDADRGIRWLLLSRALLDLREPKKALTYLDKAQRLGQGIVGDFEGMDLRARAMEQSGKPIEAATAWLQFSRNQPAEVKSKALVRAARLALSVEGEEVAVMFLHKYAVKEGCGDALVPFYNEARSRLGLEATSFENSTPTIRLDRGEQLLASGASEQASDVFASLENDFWTLSPTDRLRYGLAYGPLLSEQRSVDAAIDLLREVARSLESRENRSRIYRLVAEIYEGHGRFDEAAEAYGGKL